MHGRKNIKMHSDGGHVHYFLQGVCGHLKSSREGLKHHTHSEGALLKRL